jgi:AraC-like DNA-binding protein
VLTLSKKRRRRVDWSIIVGNDLPAPRVVNRAAPGELAALLAAFDALLPLDDPDAIMRRAVELARERIGLARVGIFLLDRARNLMLGTWGSDLHGAIVDEHQIMYAVSDIDREAFRRASELGAHFTIFEGCPIVEHSGGGTRVQGRGWLACTPIRSARATIGMLFNDAGLSGAPVDTARQTQAAILCSLLATLLDPARGSRAAPAAAPGESAASRLVAAASAMLVDQPGIGGAELAGKLRVSRGRLARVFRLQMGMSLVEYRNRLRLERFNLLLDGGCANLLEAARGAGFGSYAQFHRVFRSLRRMTPRDYVQRRG